MIAQLGGPNTAELSQILQNIAILQSGRRSCVTSKSSRAGIARAVGSQTNASIPQDRRTRARHCRRWLHLTLGDVLRGVACRRGVPSARAPSSPRYTAALVDAPLRSVCRASPCCGKPFRTAPPTRPTPSLRPRSPPSSTPPEVCQDTIEFDIQCRHGTTRRARAGGSGVPGACAFTAIARKKSGAHGVSPK